MSKRKERRQRLQIYQDVLRSASPTHTSTGENHAEQPDEEIEERQDSALSSTPEFASILSGRPALLQMKKFRFQLLHRWLTDNIAPCRAADIGGGKGLLAHLLEESQWKATVIDPVSQTLPDRYKDLASDRVVRLNAGQTVHRQDMPFEPEMAQDFDLLIGMHAHGCNVQIMEACKKYQRSFVLLPCCIIDEPLYPPPGTHWLQFLCNYACDAGFHIQPFVLNFKGQNIGLYGQLHSSDMSS